MDLCIGTNKIVNINISLIHDIEISIHGNLKVALTGSSVHSPEFQETISQSGERSF